MTRHFLCSECNSPCNQQNKRNQPAHILVGLVLGFDTDISWKVPTLYPPKLRSRHQNKAQEETCHEPTNMGKIIDTWQNPNG